MQKKGRRWKEGRKEEKKAALNIFGSLRGGDKSGGNFGMQKRSKSKHTICQFEHCSPR
jgi:hypothetical protein